MKSTIFFLVIFIHFSCVRMLPDEELTMTRTQYTGKDFRIDGYYVGTTNFLDKNARNYTNYIFFYSNAVVFSFSHYENEIHDIDEIISDMNRNRNRKDLWAVFQLEDNMIHTQGWINSGSISSDRLYSLLDGFYKIINDTTILYEKSTGYITHEFNVYYHFKQLSLKPDSTNIFIK